MKRNDCILAAAIFLFAGLLSVMFFLSGNEQGNYVTVTVDKKVYGTYPLDETQDARTVIVNGRAKFPPRKKPSSACRTSWSWKYKGRNRTADGQRNKPTGKLARITTFS